ncbi:resuscitation-promoting factor [Brevibacterium album]|uniref:resuscitation-promoting factor n=1 Tax=Brevibacterium album TaxID=417948 RepID=UPI00054E0555|nr:resuscitation-promoting factor [Brevibacterium album]
MKRKGIQIAGQAVVITALVGSTAAFVGFNKSVDLVVDGQHQQVRTFAGSVEEVLAGQNLDLSGEDRIQPGGEASVTRGMDIVVNTQKSVALSLDGVASEETTHANTVDEALADLGVDPAGAEVSAAGDAPLDPASPTELTVVTPKTVTVRADGESHEVQGTAATTGEALELAGVAVEDTDIVSSPLTAPIASGQTVDVLRTETKTETVEETVEKKVTEKKTDRMVEGGKKVEQKGADGKREVTYEIGLIDGEEVSRVETDEKVLEEPKEEIVLVGTGDPTDPDSYEISPDGQEGGTMSTAAIKEMLGGPSSPWYKIVQCESEFNPKAVNRSNNRYFGLFQFGIPTWEGVGGSGNPADASPQEQFMRAKMLQERHGWSQWECAGMVGVG